jgi:spore germination cell wall hydrolase CwlJ-like protein
VRELAGAPEHVPVRLNATPDHSLQALTDLMPEADPYLLKAHDLNRQTGCLALAIYYEARSEDTLGQIAIAQVIFNRVRSTKYPNSICRVVYQNAHRANRCQFSFACDGRTERPRHKTAWAAAMYLARALNCTKTCKIHPRSVHPFMRLSEDLRKATHYHADYVAPGWSRKLIRSGKIGRHIFYISKRVWS